MIKGESFIEFGNGTVRLTSGINAEGFGILCMETCEPHAVGEMLPPHSNDWSPVDSDVICTFSNVESLDVVIANLNRIRSYMEAFENGDFGTEFKETT